VRRERRARDAALLVAGLVVIVCVTPPLLGAARRYVVFECLQFGLVALVTPALLALGAPIDRVVRPGSTRRLARAVHERASARPRHRGILPALPSLCAFLLAVVLWRLPLAVNWLAATPAAIACEVATFVVLGPVFFSELVVSAPFVPHASSARRIALAIATMWMLWLLAYVMGFTQQAWFTSFRHPHGPISLIADQQLGAGVLWAVSAATLLPPIFVNLVRFLSDDEDVDDELRRLVRRERRATTTRPS